MSFFLAPLRPLWSRLDERRASFIAAVMIAVGPLSMALYTPALPVLKQAFDVSNAQVKLTLTLYFFGFCFSQLICGPLSDAYGRRPVALWFFAAYLAGSALAVSAPDIHVMQIARIFQGFGAAAGVAVSRALVRDLFVGQECARIMNRIGLMVALAPALAPSLGGLLLLIGSWRWIFALMLAYALALLCAIAWLMPETNVSANPKLMSPRQIMANYYTLLGHRAFMAPACVMGFTLGGIYTLPSLTPFVLTNELGLSPQQFAGAMLLPTFSLLISNMVVGRALRKFDAHRLIPIGAGLIAMSGAAFASLALLQHLNWQMLMGCASLWTFGVPFVTPGATSMALTPFPKIAGAASALMGFIQMGGGFLGSAIAAGFFNDPTTAISVLMPIIAVCMVASVIMLPKSASIGEGPGAA